MRNPESDHPARPCPIERPRKTDGRLSVTRPAAPQAIGPIPEALAAFSRIQVSIQKLIIESYRKRSKNLLLQALLLEPLVHHVGNAERMLDDMLELQSNYLPAFE